jgi:hypothetical protein
MRQTALREIVCRRTKDDDQRRDATSRPVLGAGLGGWCSEAVGFEESFSHAVLMNRHSESISCPGSCSRFGIVIKNDINYLAHKVTGECISNDALVVDRVALGNWVLEGQLQIPMVGLLSWLRPRTRQANQWSCTRSVVSGCRRFHLGAGSGVVQIQWLGVLLCALDNWQRAHSRLVWILSFQNFKSCFTFATWNFKG